MNFSQISTGMQIGAEAAPRLKKLKGAADRIEAIFIKELISEMRKGVKQVNFGQSFGGEIYQDMMDQAVADAGAKSGSFGIGKVLYSEFSKEVIRETASDVARKAMEAHNKPQGSPAAKEPTK